MNNNKGCASPARAFYTCRCRPDNVAQCCVENTTLHYRLSRLLRFFYLVYVELCKRSILQIYWYEWPCGSKNRQWKVHCCVLALSSKYQIRGFCVNVKARNTGNNFLQLVAQHCCFASWKTFCSCYHLHGQLFSCVASCVNMLRTIEGSSTFGRKKLMQWDLWLVVADKSGIAANCQTWLTEK